MLVILLIGLVSIVESGPIGPVKALITSAEDLYHTVRVMCKHAELRDWTLSDEIIEDLLKEDDDDQNDYLKILKRATINKIPGKDAWTIDEFIQTVCKNQGCILNPIRLVNNCAKVDGVYFA